MGVKRQKNQQLELAFTTGPRGEASEPAVQGVETSIAKRKTERPAETEQTSPDVCSVIAQPTEPPWYGPVCQVVWEGGGREASHYPDHQAEVVNVGNVPYCPGIEWKKLFVS